MTSQVVINSGTDILLAVLYAPGSTGTPGEPIRGFTKLEKMMFLVYEETDLKGVIGKNYHFEADNYGPCATEIYDDIEMLKDANMLETESVDSDSLIESIDFFDCAQNVEDEALPPAKRVEVFKLTSKGAKVASMIFHALPSESQQKIILLKTLHNSKSVTELIKYVYSKYPQTTTRSKIRDIVHLA